MTGGRVQASIVFTQGSTREEVSYRKNGFESLNCSKIDCKCLERLVFLSHRRSSFERRVTAFFVFSAPRHEFFVFYLLPTCDDKGVFTDDEDTYRKRK